MQSKLDTTACTSQEGYKGIVRLLLACEGVDVNSRDDDGWTPLTHASEQGHNKVAQMLKERNNNI